MQVRCESWRHRRLEAWGVGGRLAAELSEVEIRASFVANIHGFVELALGPEAIEDDGVNGDRYGFYDNLDNTADQ